MGRAVLAAGPGRLPDGDPLTEAFAAARAELVRALVRLLGSTEDAQDAAQEAFLKCWRARDRAGEVRDLKAWIFRVALNAARDLRRGVWRRRSRPLLDGEQLHDRPGASPGQLLFYGETLERLRAALAGLRPEERDVFLLRHRGEMSYDQIAALRGLPVGTVKTRMRSALQKLRRALPAG
jgi:RNA polymerase sigma-70 factor (ECF subfamily)